MAYRDASELDVVNVAEALEVLVTMAITAVPQVTIFGVRTERHHAEWQRSRRKIIEAWLHRARQRSDQVNRFFGKSRAPYCKMQGE